ncbi:phosphotransferase family protein [Polymorphobacter sp. PAMC 29334]|uniref:phosphotransferase family protein n=1 Tax=Polymorphobacter sp. PAMC 29334 TaxID=2862331 RepID=UPI001C664400|nr:phosphotransferase family protein [Polymorphobacter sp. PAMC 29334]QYE34500.1 phosphotransferase family protein [Polymorphobacter sp. PAMC 29334]
MIAALAALLKRAGHDATVERVTPLSGGASSATFAVEALRNGTPWPLIFQRGEGQIGMAKSVQAELQRISGAHGVPVAPVIAIASPDDNLGDGFFMARVEGESLASRWLKGDVFAAARAAMTAQCGAALARIHAIPLDAVAHLPLARGTAAAQCAAMFALYRSFGVDEPAFDLAFAWLAERIGDAPARVVCHGDFRSGNFIVDERGLAAVLDWELAHLGDHHADLGWLCVNAWRFGQWQRPVGGFGERAELYAAYEAAGGAAVNPARAHVWEVYGTLRWGMSCLQLADDHLSGRVRSVERAAIGRRVTEVAADLLWVIEHGSI